MSGQGSASAASAVATKSLRQVRQGEGQRCHRLFADTQCRDQGPHTLPGAPSERQNGAVKHAWQGVIHVSRASVLRAGGAPGRSLAGESRAGGSAGRAAHVDGALRLQRAARDLQVLDILVQDLGRERELELRHQHRDGGGDVDRGQLLACAACPSSCWLLDQVKPCPALPYRSIALGNACGSTSQTHTGRLGNQQNAPADVQGAQPGKDETAVYSASPSACRRMAAEAHRRSSGSRCRKA